MEHRAKRPKIIVYLWLSTLWLSKMSCGGLERFHNEKFSISQSTIYHFQESTASSPDLPLSQMTGHTTSIASSSPRHLAQDLSIQNLNGLNSSLGACKKSGQRQNTEF